MHMWLHEIMRASKQAQIDNANQLSRLRDEVVKMAQEHHRTIRDSMKKDDPADLSTKAEEICKSVLVSLEAIKNQGDEATRCQRILSSLRFKEMPLRHIQIPETYADTFSWVLNNYPFQPWLEASNSNDGAFWINGKPGSGKSTMMKMISDSTRTLEMLQRWAGQRKLVVSSFFFWSSGYPMQRSQLGLLQSLLHQILCRFPDQIPVLCVRRWRAAEVPREAFDPWTASEMIDVLRSITNTTSLEARFCFFIDGLDEFGGECHELVQTLADIGRSEAVKMCVSSRPWNVFRKVFDCSPDHQLVLQDHTAPDLDRYIRDKLEENLQFRALAKLDSSAHLYPQEIRQRAKGVFLWVMLVVRSLLRGLTEDDDMHMLRERLRNIPDELEAYFQHMMNTVEKVYHRYMARALLLASAAETPLPISTYWYLEVDRQNPEFAMLAKHEPYTRDSFSSMAKTMKTRISKYCRELLEVKCGPKMAGSSRDIDPIFFLQVDFLHRTVRDMLMSHEMRQYLHDRAGAGFRPEITLSRAFLLHAKTIPPSLLQHGHLQYAAGNMMYYVRQHELKYGTTCSDLVYELDRIGNATAALGRWKDKSHSLKSVILPSQRTWSPIWDDVEVPIRNSLLNQQVSGILHAGRNLLAYAIEFDLQIFVKQELDRDPSLCVKTTGAPLLYHALSPTFPSQLGLPKLSTPHAMATIILENQTDINQPVAAWRDETIWRKFLKSISACKPLVEPSERNLRIEDDDLQERALHAEDAVMQWQFSALEATCRVLRYDHSRKQADPDDGNGTRSGSGSRRTSLEQDEDCRTSVLTEQQPDTPDFASTKSPDDSEFVAAEDLPNDEEDDHSTLASAASTVQQLKAFECLETSIFNHLDSIDSDSLPNDEAYRPTKSMLSSEDASLLELMLHKGADPDEMDCRVLDALLEQCCPQCQVDFGREAREMLSINGEDLFPEV